ncbi:MAG: hypothetical protein COS94_10520 [Candidatus Hydrogenedentes bacterium CG07_land_8_20_14_0_80_42_17]|nr:MAG: hypothetical protein COS94_10520 [Candidatus Hydrogenedentes bacterium CG07_land_8_20_14_0_80_42_17]
MAEKGEKERKEEVVEEVAESKKTPLLQSNLVKILLGIAIVVVILTLVFFTTYYFVHYFRTSSLTPTEPVIPGVDQNQIQDPPLETDMGQYTVIIFDENGRSYNLRATILLTVNSKRPEKAEVTNELQNRMNQLTDAIYEVMIALNPKSFMGNGLQRSQGIAEMKAAIIRAVNSRMKNKVDGVFLKEFIFQ